MLRLFLICTLLFPFMLQAQITVDGQVLYGNEWIDLEQTYYSFEIAEDGLYHISGETLIEAGIAEGTPVSQLSLYRMGQEVPLRIYSDGTLSSSDEIAFFGMKQRGDLDQFLLHNEETLLNPDVALYQDKATYYLTVSEGNHLRYDVITSNTPQTVPDTETSFLRTEIVDNKSAWIKGAISTDGIQSSLLSPSEGWGTGLNTNKVIDVSTADAAESSAINELVIDAHITGTLLRGTHETEIRWNNQIVGNNTFSRDDVAPIQLTIPLQQVQDENTIRLRGIGTGTPVDRVGIGLLRCTYPSVLRGITDKLIRGELTTENNKVLEWYDFSGTGYLYAIENNTILETTVSEGKTLFNIPENLTGPILLAQDNQVKLIETLEKKTFSPLIGDNTDYLIISNKQINDDSSDNPVSAYADYRKSEQGGRYTVEIVNIDEIADQFSYGYELHPLSIKNFTNFASANWPNLKMILLIGKSLQYNDDVPSDRSAKDAFKLLPNYGSPASDNILFTTNNALSPLVAYGRIPALTKKEVSDYLKKVKIYEQNLSTIHDQNLPFNWQKRILHLGGGNNEGEIDRIKSTLDNMKDIIDNSPLGTSTFTHTKQSSGTIEDVPVSSTAAQWLDEGVIMKTYFGHGAATTTQFSNLETPTAINNIDRYPVMNAWGCYTGNCFLEASNSLGERNLFSPNTGAISYNASSGVGSISTINTYSLKYYDKVANSYYDQPIGLAHKASLEELSATSGFTRWFIEQLILMGDPAIQLSRAKGADYTFTVDAIRSEPAVINNEEESFTLHVDIANLGLAKDDSLEIEIIWTLASGEIGYSSIFTIDAPKFSTEAALTLPTLGSESVGENTLFITLDPRNKIAEFPAAQGESNNDYRNNEGNLGFTLFASSGGALPIYPSDNGIINTSMPFALKISTQNALKDTSDYLFEIDTTPGFNSPMLQTAIIRDHGGVIEYVLTEELKRDKQVYFWRVSERIADSPTQRNWIQQSFTYDAGERTGFSQSHPEQFKRNAFDSLNINDANQFAYTTREVVDLTLDLGYREGRDDDWIFVNGVSWGSLNPNALGSMVCVHIRHPKFDRYPRSVYGQYGSIDYRDLGYFYDMQDPEDRANMVQLIKDAPDESIVIIYTLINDPEPDFKVEEWDADPMDGNLLSYLENLGSENINLLKDRGSVPFYFIYDKAQGIVDEGITINVDDTLFTSYPLQLTHRSGNMSFPTIESKKVHELQWDIQKIESDSALTTIAGISAHEDDTTRFNVLLDGPGSYAVNDIGKNDCTTFQAQYFSRDRRETYTRTPQFNTLYVGHDPLDDVAIDPNYAYSINATALQEGETLRILVGIENVSSEIIDSVHIKYSLINDNQTVAASQVITDFKGYSHLVDSIALSTVGLQGNSLLLIEINPEQRFKERFLFNNILTQEIEITQDKIQPALNVTFDNRVIKNLEAVSKDVTINASLTDYESTLLLTDTSHISFRITNQAGNTIYSSYTDDEVEFLESSSLDNNTFTTTIQGNFEPDNVYTLDIAAQDATNNSSGSLNYQVQFTVVSENAQTLEDFEAIPNPASSEVNFTYFHTAATDNDNYRISVYNTRGQLLRTLTAQELGPMRVGERSFSTPWDLRAANGNPLQPGIYFYRLEYNTGIEGDLDTTGKLLIE